MTTPRTTPRARTSVFARTAAGQLLIATITFLLIGVTTADAAPREGLNSGDAPSKAEARRQNEVRREINAEVRADRREMLRQHLAKRRARLEIVASTATDSGQAIDWIRRDSQVPHGRVAAPPPFQGNEADLAGDESSANVAGDQLAAFELAHQQHARGPEGTVPVLRRDVDAVLDNVDPPEKMDDFLSKYGRADWRGGPKAEPNSFAVPGAAAHEYAYSAQYVDNYGGHGNINVWNPWVYDRAEFSLGQVAVVRENGGGAKQTIEAGWQDYRNLYGDYSPHFFIFFTTNGYARQADNLGGYNRDVDGFVQYSSTVFPGARITAASSFGGSQYSTHFRVQLYAGNWWIRMNNEWVGYYPARLFATNGLRYKADKISWYGEIVDLDDGFPTFTDMGSGGFADRGFGYAAYMRNVVYYDDASGYTYDYDPDTSYATEEDCYTIETHFRSRGSWGSYFYWGGPGRSGICS
jgi:hypothetical protein